jgi:anti-anti-sigma factor
VLNDLEIGLRHAPPLVIIDLRGEVTTFVQEPLIRAYQEALAIGTPNIMLNFRDVGYLNSAGIAAIIGLIGEARKTNQRILLTGLTPHYQVVFDMMGLTAFAPLFESEEAARAAIESS